MALENINLFDPETLVDPYPAYQALRNEAPVHFVEALNIHFVTRYDLIREAIMDTQTYSSKFDGFMNMTREAGLASATPEVRERIREIEQQLIPNTPTMLTLDQPDHTKYRSLVAKLFTGGQVKKSQDQVEEVIKRVVEQATSGTSMEFMSEFAFPVPLRIIGDRLGIPEKDRVAFDEGATSAASGLRMAPLTSEILLRRAEIALELQSLLVGLLEARREDPQDDMITILATSKLEEEDRHLTHGEALSILGQFLVAGHETTSSSFGWGMLQLCQNPALQDEMRGDAKLIKTFVEESLRVESPVQGLPRVVTQDTELGGYPIKAGQMVMLRFGAANRDERQFEDPDNVNIYRNKAGAQLAFGSGVHHCIGAPLARQELNLGYAALLDRMRNIRLADEQDIPKAEPSFILRNLPYLKIEFDRV